MLRSGADIGQIRRQLFQLRKAHDLSDRHKAIGVARSLGNADLELYLRAICNRYYLTIYKQLDSKVNSVV